MQWTASFLPFGHNSQLYAFVTSTPSAWEKAQGDGHRLVSRKS